MECILGSLSVRAPQSKSWNRIVSKHRHHRLLHIDWEHTKRGLNNPTISFDSFRQVSTVYTKSKVKIDKGVAFPTSISLNNVVGHYSALEGDTLELKEGDVVKM